MTTIEFIANFEENVVFVPVGTLTVESVLDELEDWDSMATVATIALVDESFGVQLNGTQLLACQTLNDLIELVKHKLED
ncbi:acyl carrier protein [Paenibacillus gorillae]|uniref:acyl carrier protein n=1 Tax=Paenibacillus gorillae TaxID=1243662 RepID=UPI0004B6C327|nr:acyl carrier protein [Paenibacillus gorillae]